MILIVISVGLFYVHLAFVLLNYINNIYYAIRQQNILNSNRFQSKHFHYFILPYKMEEARVPEKELQGFHMSPIITG